MKTNLTEIIVLYGDNIPQKEFAGTDQTIRKALQPLKESGVELRFTVAAFGAGYSKFCENAFDCTVAAKNHAPGGDGYGNAPVDAAVLLAREIGVRYCGTPEVEIPGRIVFVMAVLGKDNASKQFTYEHLKEVVEHQSYVYKWEFFMLTDEPANVEKLSIQEDNAVIVSCDADGYFQPAIERLFGAVAGLNAGQSGVPSDVTEG